MMPRYIHQNQTRISIVQLGNAMKRQLNIETSEQRDVCAIPILSPQEISLISERLLNGQFDIAAAYRERLELGREFYFEIRRRLMAVLQVWDAVIDVKEAFDQLKSSNWNREFMEAFLLCTDTIPTRANIGSLEPLDHQTVDPFSTVIDNPHFLDSLVGRDFQEVPWRLKQANGVQLLQDHDPEDMALSDPDASDTTTDDDSDEDDEDYEECSEGNESYEENVLQMIPRQASMLQNIPQNDRPFLAGTSEDWDSDLQMLVNDSKTSFGSELSDSDDVAAYKRTPSPFNLNTLENDPRAFDMIDMGSQYLVERQQQQEPTISATIKKRRRIEVAETENRARDNKPLPAKRQKKCGTKV
ncbi:hypothetical protein LZ30DRAFT_723020 [Colletotrichum cereale]|nr:hypothetical protein LZ30DRAFT_723020 [Colletotrichum cereale]